MNEIHLINVVLFSYKGLTHEFDEGTGRLVLMYKKMQREYNWNKLLYRIENGKRIEESRPYGTLLDEVDKFIDFVDANPEIINRFENLNRLYGERL
jgi:hypothetical protein